MNVQYTEYVNIVAHDDYNNCLRLQLDPQIVALY